MWIKFQLNLANSKQNTFRVDATVKPKIRLSKTNYNINYFSCGDFQLIPNFPYFTSCPSFCIYHLEFTDWMWIYLCQLSSFWWPIEANFFVVLMSQAFLILITWLVISCILLLTESMHWTKHSLLDRYSLYMLKSPLFRIFKSIFFDLFVVITRGRVGHFSIVQGHFIFR